MKRFRAWSLGARMAAVYSILLAAVGVFMLAFFPARMAVQAENDAKERVASLAHVMSTALGPAVEFADPENAASILQWLASASDARFGVVRDADGVLLAVWGAGLAVETDRSLLSVTMPIAETGGTLHLGFSRHELLRERARVFTTVALTVLMVVALGVLATVVLARYLVRPIRTITRTALKVSRGELPPALPDVAGSDEIVQMVASLRAMLERIHEVSQQELLAASRQAGMAEVATGVLHNVGNVLTSVNVTIELYKERIEKLPLDRLRKLHELLGAALAAGTVDTAKLAAAVKYLDVVASTLEAGRDQSRRDLQTLSNHVDHIKRVVAMQNAYARVRSAAEPTRVAAVIDEAIEIACPPHRRGDIAIDVAVADAIAAGSLMVDRHRILQILVNLVSNARDAVNMHGQTKRISISAARTGDALRLEVNDSGVGIAPELAARIFGAGVTSKPNGHGYGLHSSALSARQMGGTLTCSSEGTGRGATFTLTIPIEVSKS